MRSKKVSSSMTLGLDKATKRFTEKYQSANVLIFRRRQLLDVLYSRQMKSIIRRADDRVILDQLSISMSTRDNIIRLVSMMLSQMCTKIFHGLVHYTWHASGYVDNHVGVCKTVLEVCFGIHTVSCQAVNCDQSPSIRCS